MDSFFKYLKIFFILLGLALLGTGAFFAVKIYDFQKKVTVYSNGESSRTFAQKVQEFTNPELKNLKGEGEGRINILLLGMTGKGYSGEGLTDTIMVASLDTRNYQTAFISIPRDLYVEIPQKKVKTKINSIYNLSKKEFCQEKNDKEKEVCALKSVRDTISDITDLPIHYFVIATYDGFEKIVDSIGGINVTVERDILDIRYPGPNHSYETFEIKKGLQQLNGATALKYARERHSDPEGDFGRAKRQQQILKSVRNKVFSTKTYLNAFAVSELISSLGETLTTDIAWEEYPSFIELAKKVNLENSNNIVIDAWKPDSLLKVSHINAASGQRMFMLIPRINNYSEIQELVKNAFDLTALERKKAEIEKENPKILIVTNAETAHFKDKIKKLLRERITYPEPAFSDKTIETPEQTLIFSLNKEIKPFSLDDLAKKFQAEIRSGTDTMADEDYDFAIIIGEDMIRHFEYEEDSLEDLENSQLESEQLFYY